MVVSLLVFLFLPGCDDDPQVVETPDVTNEVRANLSHGRWMVSDFLYEDVDVTETFATYRFEFESSGVFTGEDGRYTHFGNWEAIRNPEEANTIDQVDLSISFSIPEEFKKLSQTWRFVSHEDASIKLVSDAGHLEFVRIN
jgi:hypothetical protein